MTTPTSFTTVNARFSQSLTLDRKTDTKSIYTRSIILHEHVDAALIRGFLANVDDTIYSDEDARQRGGFKSTHAHVRKFMEQYDAKKGIAKTKLCFAAHKWGRVKPTDHISLSVLHRPTRHAFCAPYYVDFDLKNASQNILRLACQQRGIDTPMLDAYCANREPFLADVCAHHNVSRDAAKQLFIAESFGGSYAAWRSRYEVPYDVPTMPGSKEMEAEYAGIIDIVYEDNPSIIIDVIKANPDKYNKYASPAAALNAKKRTCASLFYQTVEKLMQETMIRYLVDNRNFKLRDIIPCQDGFMVPKDRVYEGLTAECEAACLAAFGFSVPLEDKPFDEAVVIPPPPLPPLSPPQETPPGTAPLTPTGGAEAVITPEQIALIEKYIPRDISTDVAAVLFVQSLVPDKFMWIDKELYCWTGLKWEKSIHEFVRYLSGEASQELLRRCDAVVKDTNISSELAKTAAFFGKKAASAWKCFSVFTRVIKTSESYLERIDVEFDAKTDLLGFDNGVYDLNAHEFRPYRYDDYMTMSCGYDYVPFDKVDPERLVEVEDLLRKIMPNDENRQLLLQLLSAGLTGRPLEFFVMLNGGGRNGKGLVNENVANALGDYGLIYANVSLLTEDDKTGANPEKAAIDKKRMVVMKEPRANTPINNDRVKDMTGGGNLSGRMLYSNKTKIELHLLLMMECNERPKFAEEPKAAEYERMIDLEFPHRFSTIESEIDNVTVFPADAKYKTAEWKEAHRPAFMHILLQALKGLQANEYKPVVPQNVRDRTNAYLNLSFPILELFESSYTCTWVETDVVKMKDVYEVLKRTDAFANFTKKEKRVYTYKYVCEFFQKHRDMRVFYCDRLWISGVNCYSVLKGYRLTADVEQFEETGHSVEFSEV